MYFKVDVRMLFVQGVPIVNRCCVPIKLISIISNRFGGASADPQFNRLGLLRSCWLLKHVGDSRSFVTSNIGGSVEPAEIAIRTITIYIILPRNIQRVSILKFRHTP